MDELVLRKYSGNDKIKTIQTLRELFALDLSEAKEIVDDLSSGTEKIMQTENGSKVITELKAVGILAEFLKDNEAATLSDDVVESMGREELITHLEAAIKCIQTLNSIQEEYELMKQKAEEIKKKKAAIEAKGTGWIIAGVAWCVVWFGLAFAGLGDGKWGQVVLGVVLIFVGIKAIKYFSAQSDAKSEERKAEANAYYEKEYPPVAQRISDLQAKAKDIIRSQDYKNMRVMIPDDYLDTEVIYEIARILKNRRAKSLSEAINLYEADLHQQRMEAAANRTADANERTANANEKSAAYSEKIAKNTKSAARAAKLNAFINFMK